MPSISTTALYQQNNFNQPNSASAELQLGPDGDWSSHNPAPAVRVKARPRQVGMVKALLTLSRNTGVVWRSYYYAGTARIALREVSDGGTQVYYILTDHLGSTTLTYRTSDGHVDPQHNKPWGEPRPGPESSLPTDRTFQGQRETSWGLTHFGARWFDSSLGRFAQADTVVPGAGNPLAWDRYAGLGNNPVRYSDPTGHDPCDSIPDDAGKAACKGSSNTSSSVPPTPIQPIKLKGWDPYYGEPQPDDTSCAVTSMAAALSILLKGKVSAKDLDRLVEKSGLAWPGFLTKFGIPAYRQDDVLNMIADWGWASFTAEYHDGGTRNDLIDNLNNGYPTIVSVSWGGVSDGVGHALLLTSYDPSTNLFTFFDPGVGKEIPEGKVSYPPKSFDDVWLNQENIFIPSGSYVTIIPNP